MLLLYTDSGVQISNDVGLRSFTFNGAFAAGARQDSVYNSVMGSLVMDFINGYNATALVYGQTGTPIHTNTHQYTLTHCVYVTCTYLLLRT